MFYFTWTKPSGIIATFSVRKLHKTNKIRWRVPVCRSSCIIHTGIQSCKFILIDIQEYIAFDKYCEKFHDVKDWVFYQSRYFPSSIPSKHFQLNILYLNSFSFGKTYLEYICLNGIWKMKTEKSGLTMIPIYFFILFSKCLWGSGDAIYQYFLFISFCD